MIQPVSSNSHTNPAAYNAGNNNINIIPSEPLQQTAEEPAAILYLSEQMKAFLLSPNDRGWDEEILKLDGKGNMGDKGYGTSTSYNEVDRAASIFLYGKVENYEEVAHELGRLLKSYTEGAGETTEEHVANRESGVKLAEYLVQNYITDPDEAKVFMDRVNEAIKFDILKEKGYQVDEGESEKAYKPYALRSHPNVINPSNEFFAEKLGWDLEEMGGDEGKWRDFRSAARKAYRQNFNAWNREVVARFNDNEKRVTEEIEKARAALDEDQLALNLQELIKKLGLRGGEES